MYSKGLHDDALNELIRLASKPLRTADNVELPLARDWLVAHLNLREKHVKGPRYRCHFFEEALVK